MTDSIEPGSLQTEEASPHACKDDDAQPSIETVITSLPSRSKAERQALLQALLDGDHMGTENGAVSGLTSTDPENTGKTPQHLASLTPKISTHPVSGTISNH